MSKTPFPRVKVPRNPSPSRSSRFPVFRSEEQILKKISKNLPPPLFFFLYAMERREKVEEYLKNPSPTSHFLLCMGVES